MANKKISQLTDGTSFQAGDEAVVNRSGTNYKVDPTQFGSSINVTGTVTADGLTVDGAALIRDAGADAILTLQRTGSVTSGAKGAVGWKDSSNLYVASIQAATDGADNAGSIYFRTDNDSTGNTGPYTAPLRMAIDSGGDISFYEDTGTTPKLFWDASAESLGIGTTSPTSTLTVLNTDKSNGVTLTLTNGYSGSGWTANDILGSVTFRTDDISANYRERAQIQALVSGGASTYPDEVDLVFSTADGQNPVAERMRIDHTGNVGIGTSSPSYPLTISDAGDGIKLEVTDTVDANFRVQVSGSNIITGPSTSSAYIFQTANTERLRIDSGGNLLVGTTTSPSDTGTVVADGIYLGGTVAANLLDDYEEGTWTVSFADALTGGNASATTATGTYTKVGRIVTARFNVSNIDTTGMTAGNRFYILGLPFTSSTNSVASNDLRNVTFGGNPFAVLDGSSTKMFFQDSKSATAFDDLLVSDFPTGSNGIILQITYETAA